MAALSVCAVVYMNGKLAPPGVGVVVIGCLVHRQPGNSRAEPERRFETERRAGRMAEHAGCAAGHLDQRVEIPDLALHRVWPGIAAVTSSAPVVAEDAEVLRQAFDELRLGAEGARAQRVAQQR
jgi:hypothetical protein